MATKNPRINITLEESVVKILANVAKNEDKTMAKLTKELVLEALERREDLALSAIAQIRDKEKTKKVSHAEAWK